MSGVSNGGTHPREWVPTEAEMKCQHERAELREEIVRLRAQNTWLLVAQLDNALSLAEEDPAFAHALQPYFERLVEMLEKK